MTEFKPGDIVYMWDYDLGKPQVAIYLEVCKEYAGNDFVRILKHGQVLHSIYIKNLYRNEQDCKPFQGVPFMSGQEVIQIQPMPIPNALIFYLDYNFGKTE